MYGGHITDDWDRRLCKTYLEEYMKPELVHKIHTRKHTHVTEYTLYMLNTLLNPKLIFLLPVGA